MRNPLRKAGYFTAALLLGIALAWTGVELQGPTDKVLGTWLMIPVGGLTAFAAAIWLLMSLLHVRGMAKLLAGFGRISAWHVGAAEWDKFRAVDAERARANPTFLVNDLWIRQRTPPEGVDVIVGEKSLVVDGSYHVLRRNGLPELRDVRWLDHADADGRPPDCIEFQLAYPKGKYGVQHKCLRVPVPESARVQGRQAYDHFAPRFELLRAKGPIALRNPRRTLQVSGVILAASLIALGWSGFVAEPADANGYVSLTWLALLIGGAIGTVFALLVAGLTLLLRPKGPR